MTLNLLADAKAALEKMMSSCSVSPADPCRCPNRCIFGLQKVKIQNMYMMAIIKIIYNPRIFLSMFLTITSSYYQWFRFIKMLSLISSHILMSLDLNTSLSECWSGTKNFNIRLFVTKHVLVHVYRSCQDMDLLVECILLPN